MGEFAYRAKDARGRVRTGKIQAASVAEAKSALTKQRLKQVSIKAAGGGKGGNQSEDLGGILGQFIYKDKNGNWNVQIGEPKASTKDLIVFSKQFSTMISSGVPLIQALGILANQQNVRSFGRALRQVQQLVENGSTLSQSMLSFPDLFDSLYVSMVKAGEASGNLDTIMMKLVTYIEKAAKIKSQVKAALMYPAIVLIVAIGVVSGLLLFVVPTFARQYEGSGKELPGLTQIVVDLSNFLANYWYLIFGIGALVVAGSGKWFRTPGGRAVFDKYILKSPLFGPLMRKIAVGRFCSTMATMLTSGVNLLEALTICAASSGNKTIETFVLRVRGSIEQGSKFSDPLSEGGLFPEMVVSMVAVGETTGALDDMLVKVSEFYEDEVDLAVKTMLGLIEPIMIVGLGGIIGFVVLAMYLPVFDMAGTIG